VRSALILYDRRVIATTQPHRHDAHSGFGTNAPDHLGSSHVARLLARRARDYRVVTREAREYLTKSLAGTLRFGK
jgi:hypothetical protein